ncbi:MAG: glycosyltransferase WbuB, partial [Terriglobia bacterium]
MSTASALTILKGSRRHAPPVSPDSTVITFEQLKSQALKPSFWTKLFGYQRVQLLTNQLETLPKPLLTAILVRLLSHGPCELRDDHGGHREVNLTLISSLTGQWMRDLTNRAVLLQDVQEQVKELGKDQKPVSNPCDFSLSPVYLRTDLSFGVTSGGSVGHIAGVLNHFAKYTGPPIFLTTDRIPTVCPDIETQVFSFDHHFWNFQELPSFHLNELIYKQALEILANRKL